MSETPQSVTVTTDPRQRINAPAVALLIMGIVGGLWALAVFLMNVLGTGMGTMLAEGSGEDRLAMLFSGGLGIAASLLGLLIAGFIIYASMKMKNLQSWSMCVTASILAMIPCISPCCVLGLPVGIWCLVILFDQNVKGAFN
jgi:predicted lysophospholipase L1 biosynthesis ABC-type transport system permease subunit